MDDIFKCFFNTEDGTEDLDIHSSNENRVIAKDIYLSIPRNIQEDLVLTNHYLQMGYAVILNLKYLSTLEIRQFITTYLNSQTSIMKLSGNMFFVRIN